MDRSRFEQLNSILDKEIAIAKTRSLSFTDSRNLFIADIQLSQQQQQHQPPEQQLLQNQQPQAQTLTSSILGAPITIDQQRANLTQTTPQLPSQANQTAPAIDGSLLLHEFRSQNQQAQSLQNAYPHLFSSSQQPRISYQSPPPPPLHMQIQQFGQLPAADPSNSSNSFYNSFHLGENLLENSILNYQARSNYQQLPTQALKQQSSYSPFQHQMQQQFHPHQSYPHVLFQSVGDQSTFLSNSSEVNLQRSANNNSNYHSTGLTRSDLQQQPQILLSNHFNHTIQQQQQQQQQQQRNGQQYQWQQQNRQLNQVAANTEGKENENENRNQNQGASRTSEEMPNSFKREFANIQQKIIALEEKLKETTLSGATAAAISSHQQSTTAEYATAATNTAAPSNRSQNYFSSGMLHSYQRSAGKHSHTDSDSKNKQQSDHENPKRTTNNNNNNNNITSKYKTQQYPRNSESGNKKENNRIHSSSSPRFPTSTTTISANAIAHMHSSMKNSAKKSDISEQESILKPRMVSRINEEEDDESIMENQSPIRSSDAEREADAENCQEKHIRFAQQHSKQGGTAASAMDSVASTSSMVLLSTVRRRRNVSLPTGSRGGSVNMAGGSNSSSGVDSVVAPQTHGNQKNNVANYSIPRGYWKPSGHSNWLSMSANQVQSQQMHEQPCEDLMYTEEIKMLEKELAMWQTKQVKQHASYVTVCESNKRDALKLKKLKKSLRAMEKQKKQQETHVKSYDQLFAHFEKSEAVREKQKTLIQCFKEELKVLTKAPQHFRV